MKKLAMVLVLFLQISSLGGYNSVRIFYIANGPILSDNYILHRKAMTPPALPADFSHDGLLVRAKRAGYTHLYAQFSPKACTDSTYKSYIHDAFMKAEKYGLKLIPAFPVSSGHGKDNWDNYPVKYMNSGGAHYCTPFTNSQNFITNTFARALTGIKDAFTQAKKDGTARKTPFLKNKSIEYIFMNFDECYDAANPDPGRNFRTVPSFTTLCAFSNPDDQDYITHGSANKNKDIAFRELYAKNIDALLREIQRNLFPTTKMIIFSDMFDPEFCGVWKFHTFLDGKDGRPDVDVVFSPNDGSNSDVLDLPGLSAAQKANVKANVVCAPWCYYSDEAGNRPYNADTAFRYFTGKGFKMIFTSALICPKGGNTIMPTSYQMLNEYALKSKKSSYNVIGSFAAFWPCALDGDWNQGNCPGNDCRCGKNIEANYWNSGTSDHAVEFSIIELLAQKMGFYPK
jgi:hypothetical protein